MPAMPDPDRFAPDLPPHSLTDDDYTGNRTNALIHLYRSESYKMVSYRVRLDQTTNWAVVTTAGLASLAFGTQSHVIFIFAMFMNFYFLRLEARRFRSYEVAHHRVRVLERFFFPVMLGEKVDADWHKFLLGELEKPRSPISIREALGWRLGRNYLWIYMGVLVAWLGKLASLYPAAQPPDIATFAALAHVGPLSGWAVLAGVAIFYTYLFVLAASARRLYPLEDD